MRTYLGVAAALVGEPRALRSCAEAADVADTRANVEPVAASAHGRRTAFFLLFFEDRFLSSFWKGARGAQSSTEVRFRGPRGGVRGGELL